MREILFRGKMKRTCKNCRALSDGRHGLYCTLGYKTKGKYYNGIEIGLIPLEECPKPLTIEYFLRLQKERNKKLEEKVQE